MTQGPRTGAWRLNAGLFHVPSDDSGDSHAAEWPKGSLGAEKHFAEWCLSKSMLEISNDGFSDRFKQWQHHFLSAFLGTDADSRLLPVDVIQQQFGCRDATNSVSHHQNGNRVIACTHGAVLVDRIENTFQSGVLHPFG